MGWVIYLQTNLNRRIRKQTIATAVDVDGFTLAELLVGIGTLSFLLILIASSLLRGAQVTIKQSCIENQRQLARAWQLYASDHQGRLVNFATSPGMLSLKSNPPWRTDVVGGLVTTTVPTGYTAKQAWIYKVEMGYKQPTPTNAGPLFAYAPDVSVIHCPDDQRFRLPVGAGFGWDSYSAVSLLNGEEGGFTNQTQILHPSERFLWAEGADSRGENVGSWTMEDYGTASNGFADARFGDTPGIFHGDSSTFSFGDGHVETHRWLETTTLQFARIMAANNGSDPTEANQSKTAAQLESLRDQQWLGSHYPGPQNP